MSERENPHGYARVVRALSGDEWVVPEAFMPADQVSVLAAAHRLLDGDPVAATIVAATINTRQAAGEPGPAFVKRIVRAWLTEMARSAS